MRRGIAVRKLPILRPFRALDGLLPDDQPYDIGQAQPGPGSPGVEYSIAPGYMPSPGVSVSPPSSLATLGLPFTPPAEAPTEPPESLEDKVSRLLGEGRRVFGELGEDFGQFLREPLGPIPALEQKGQRIREAPDILSRMDIAMETNLPQPVQDVMQVIPAFSAMGAVGKVGKGSKYFKQAMKQETPIERAAAESKGISDIEGKLGGMKREIEKGREFPPYYSELPEPSIGEKSQAWKPAAKTPYEQAVEEAPGIAPIEAKLGQMGEEISRARTYPLSVLSLPEVSIGEPGTTTIRKRGLFGTKETTRVGGTTPPLPPTQKPPTTPTAITPSGLPQDNVERLKYIIENFAKPSRAEQDRLVTLEKGMRLRKYEALSKAATTREEHLAARGALKGEYGKIKFAPSEGQFTPDEVNDFYSRIEDGVRNEVIDRFQKISVENGLEKVFLGQAPQPGELVLLDRIFPGLGKAVYNKRGMGTKALEIISELWNLPRALLASFDSSYLLRQGALITAGHPSISGKTLGPAMKAMFSEKYANDVYHGILNDPLYKRVGSLGPDITHWTGPLNMKEERFVSRLAERIPFVRASNRNYTTGLNKMRWDLYKQKVLEWEKAGIDPTTNLAIGKNQADYEAAGRTINILSGRGDLGKLNDKVIYAAAFSPRYVWSRFQAPALLADPVMRGEAARALGIFFGTNLGLLAAAKVAGIADVELDQRSSDFAKLKVGDTRIDTMGGYSQLIRFVAQMATEQRKTVTKRVATQGRDVSLGRFLESKSSPGLGLMIDFLRKEDYQGNPMNMEPGTVASQAYQRLAPLFLQDMIETFVTNGLLGQDRPLLGTAALAGPASAGAFLGLGVQTYPKSPNEVLLQTQNEVAQKTAGAPWEKLAPNTAWKLSQTSPEIKAAQETKAMEKKPTTELNMKEAVDTAKQLQAQLPPETQAVLKSVNMRLSNVDRTLSYGGEPIYLNDARLEAYKGLIVENVSKFLPQYTAKLPADPTQKRLTIAKALKAITEFTNKQFLEQLNKGTP